jgi:NADH-quinone oxidoreductase subunit G
VPAGLAGVSPSDDERAIAASLADGERKAVFLGNAAVQCDRAGIVAQLAQAIADATGARLGFLGEAANSVGGWIAGALPADDGRDARAMVAEPLSAYLLLGSEPWLDHAMPRPAREALAKAETVVALTAFRSPELMELADCLLPIAPFTETSGTFVNCEGRAQSFNGVVRPLGDTRPGWKVLRVLGNLLELPGFDFESSESVRARALEGDLAARLDNRVAVDLAALTLQPAEALAAGTLERLADVPIYSVDPLVRRAESLQRTRDARPPQARMSAATLASLGLSAGERVRVAQGGGEALVEAAQDDTVAAGVVRLAAAHPSTAGLASMFGAVTVARA